MGAFPHALWIWGEEWSLDSLLQDIRYGIRTLAKRPGFTGAALLTLALGIGGNTAIFSIVDSVLLRPLPLPDSEQLVWVSGTLLAGEPGARVSPPDFRDYRSAELPLELGAYLENPGTLTGSDRPISVTGAMVTSNLLKVLGYRPVLGRTFSPEEEEPGADAVMISSELWQSRFGGSREVLGSVITVDGNPRTVVGVLPPRMGLLDLDLWTPLPVLDPSWSSRSTHFLLPIGRLGEGTTLREAQLAMDAVSRRLEEAYPDTNDGWYAQLVPLQERLVGDARGPLLLLMVAVGMVLLIAIGNVASLLLARASIRHGEIALRSAMGASRLRVVRQLVTESLALSLLGGGAGLVLAYGAGAVLRRVQPASLPRLDELAVNGTALAFTLVLSLAVGLAFGLIPAMQLSREGVAEGLREGNRTGRGRAGQGLRNVLVALEMALSVVLLVGASLLTRSLVSLNAVDPGVDPEGVLTARVDLSPARFPGREERNLAMDQILEGIRSIPGVEAAAAVNQIPFGGGGGDTYVFARGRPPEKVLDPANTAQIRAVTDDYFSTMGIAVLRGRAFGLEDRGADALSTIIDEELARRLWPNEDPLGRELVLALDSITARVVGVVKDVRQFGLGEPPAASFFLPFGQYSPSGMNLVVKAADRGVVMEPLRAAVWEVDPDQPLTRVELLDEMIRSTTASNRFQTALLGVFALMALFLASIGIYGVLSFYVGQRRREIGIRMALGAEPGSTVGLVLRRGGILIVGGVVSGLAGSAALTRLLAGLLYGVEPMDPVSFLVAPLILVTVAFLASYLPARRASRIDPAVALRIE